MQALYAAGFNAWGQLQFGPTGYQTNDTQDHEPEDKRTFTRVLENSGILHVRASLTYTSVTTPDGIIFTGAAPLDKINGAEDENSLYFSETLNGCVAVYDKPHGTLLQYASIDDFVTARRYVGSPTDIPFTCFTGFLGITQIVAYDVGFAALAADGGVWTWGDPRFPECLGRGIDDTPAEHPGRVASLDDLPTGPIVKLAAGGHVLAAVTQGRDLYCWGGYPGRRPVLEGVTGEPTPIIISTVSPNGDDEEADIVNVGIGDGHMIVLAADGSVFVIGSNANGQLGLGFESVVDEDDDEGSQTSEAKTPSAWVKVAWVKVNGLLPDQVTGVYAGPRSSFVVVTE